jgi:hypothetical protein
MKRAWDWTNQEPCPWSGDFPRSESSRREESSLPGLRTVRDRVRETRPLRLPSCPDASRKTGRETASGYPHLIWTILIRNLLLPGAAAGPPADRTWGPGIGSKSPS